MAPRDPLHNRLTFARRSSHRHQSTPEIADSVNEFGRDKTHLCIPHDLDGALALSLPSVKLRFAAMTARFQRPVLAQRTFVAP